MNGNLCRCMTYTRISGRSSWPPPRRAGAQDDREHAMTLRSLPPRLPDRRRRAGLVTSSPPARWPRGRRRAGSLRADHWYSIDKAGIVTVNVIRAEMGQHVGTAIARILADELEAVGEGAHRPRRIRSQMGPDGHRRQLVGVADLSALQPGRRGRPHRADRGRRQAAGRPGRQVRGPQRRGRSGGKTISYGDIVAKGELAGQYTAEELAKMPIKPVADRKLIGKPAPAATSSRRPTARASTASTPSRRAWSMAARSCRRRATAHRSTRSTRPPPRRSTATSTRVALKDPSNTVPGWVMVIADSFAAAEKAAEGAEGHLGRPGPAPRSPEALQAHAALIADRQARAAWRSRTRACDAAFRAAKSTHEATYTTATALHFQMEPLNALAFEKDGKWRDPHRQPVAEPRAAVAGHGAGRKEETSSSCTYLLGGGFGRRLNGDYAVGAALASQGHRQAGEDDHDARRRLKFDSVRSPSVQKVRMAFDKDGNVTAMEHHACAGWPTEGDGALLHAQGREGRAFDPFAINGANHWYTVGAHRVARDLQRPRQQRPSGRAGCARWGRASPTGRWRASSTRPPHRLKWIRSSSACACSTPAAATPAPRPTPSAAPSGRPRWCSGSAAKAGWGKPLPKNTGLGLATSFGQERDMPTWVACVARVKVDPATGDGEGREADAGRRRRHHRRSRRRTRADGRRLALGPLAWRCTKARRSRTARSRTPTSTPTRRSGWPTCRSSTSRSSTATEAPVGLGEPATTIVGPAIGNAIYNAVGARVRDLPIRPAAVKAAMKT